MRFPELKVMSHFLYLLVIFNVNNMYAQLTGNAPDLVTFTKIQLYNHYISEGAAIADNDRDGHPDIISGPLWWKGPDFKEFKTYDTLVHYPITGPGISGYSKIFFTFPDDFDGEGSPDILQISLPGEDSRIFYNVEKTRGKAEAHPAIPKVANESPLVTDIIGDGKPELVAFSDGQLVLGLAPANWDQKSHWSFHPYQFSGQAGGSQILIFDVNSDGKNDVVTAMNAHGYGLFWFQQRSGIGETIGFEKHEILSESPTRFVSELNFSQLHAMAKADIDGDGLMDFVNGKCF